MTSGEKLAGRIRAAGSAGTKKTDLRKEFGEIDAALEALVSKGEVFIDKRKSAYYCFHRDHYIQSLLNSDPRFRLTYELVKSLEESVKGSSRTVEVLASGVSNLARVVNENAGRATESASAAPRRTVTVSDFKDAFDSALAGSATSIGWVELATIRDQVCARCNITSDEFYRLVGELAGQYQDRYELSTGGGEGVMVRGLLHGFVRCI